jgi:hypothetical protein
VLKSRLEIALRPRRLRVAACAQKRQRIGRNEIRYAIPRDYEARLSLNCDPFDDSRTVSLTARP